VMALILLTIVALPYRFLARRWNIARGWLSAVIGLVVGSLCVYAMDYTIAHTPAFAPTPLPISVYLEFAVVGAATGFVFWLLAKEDLRPRTPASSSVEHGQFTR